MASGAVPKCIQSAFRFIRQPLTIGTYTSQEKKHAICIVSNHRRGYSTEPGQSEIFTPRRNRPNFANYGARGLGPALLRSELVIEKTGRVERSVETPNGIRVALGCLVRGKRLQALASVNRSKRSHLKGEYFENKS